MNEGIRFTVPLVPPSVNHYVKHTRRGRHYVTCEAKAFKAAMVYCAQGKRVIAEKYGVELMIFLGANQKGDIFSYTSGASQNVRLSD